LKQLLATRRAVGLRRKRHANRRNSKLLARKKLTSRHSLFLRMPQLLLKCCNRSMRRAAHLEKVEAEVRDWEKPKRQNCRNGAEKAGPLKSRISLATSHAGKNFCVAEVQDGDGQLLQAVVDALKSKFKGSGFLVGAANGSVALVASVPKEDDVDISGEQI